MTHYVVTRYNLGAYSDNPMGVADVEAWMKDRANLFKPCKESILSQQADFEWLVCVDPKTPQRWLDQIFTDSRMKMVICQPADIQYNSAWKITSRIDSDDMYLPGALQAIQDHATESTALIDIRYKISGGSHDLNVVKRNRPNSMFCSLVNNDPTESVYCRPHSFLPDDFPGQTIDKVLAVKVEHGGNLYLKQGSNWL